MKPIPDNFESLLSAKQLMTLRTIEQRGWTLYFIRRDGLQEPVTVVQSVDGKAIGVIEEGGDLNTTPNLKIRINPERMPIL